MQNFHDIYNISIQNIHKSTKYMKNKKQSGNVHVITITVIAILLTSLVFIIFAQKNILNKKPRESKSQSKQTTNTSTDDSTGTIVEDVFSTKLALDYPKSWKVTNSANKSGAKYKGRDLGTNNYILQSPDKNFEVQFLVISGMMSTHYCDEQRDIYELETLDIPNYEKAKLVIVGYFREDNMLSYYAGAMNNNNNTNNLTKTDSECKIELESNLSINDNVEAILRIHYNYQDPNPDEVNVVNEYEEFMKAKELNSFKEAKEIIQSLHIIQD